MASNNQLAKNTSLVSVEQATYIMERMNLIEATTYDYELSFKMSERITSPVRMLHYIEQFKTGEETEQAYDIFIERLEGYLSDNDCRMTLRSQYFTGISDVIVEFDVEIEVKKGRSDDKPPLNSECILGTVLTEIRKHFNIHYHSMNAKYIDDEVFSNYFNY